MIERENVMRGLEACSSCLGSCSTECPYYSHTRSCTGVQLKKDALALLREQEPRVMTVDEVEEMAAKSDPDPVFAEWIMGGTGWIVGCIHLLADMMKNGYNIRVWTSRPTPEQMRDTKWEGDNDAD